MHMNMTKALAAVLAFILLGTLLGRQQQPHAEPAPETVSGGRRLLAIMATVTITLDLLVAILSLLYPYTAQPEIVVICVLRC